MKKGFTLVELIAVIVVLSVIMLVASNSVLGNMKRSRSQLGEIAKKNLEDSAISYAVSNFSIPGKPNYITDKCAKDHDVTTQGGDSCVKRIKVQDLIDEGFFNDTNGNCKKDTYLLIYKYKKDKQVEFRAYIPEDVCKN